MFVQTHCRIPSEVLYEARDLPDIDVLYRLEYSVTGAQLEQLRVIMGTINPGDRKLIDLYQNQGNADPILIAAALDATDRSAATLFPETWSVVTDDVALTTTAVQFDVPTLTSAEFLCLLT